MQVPSPITQLLQRQLAVLRPHSTSTSTRGYGHGDEHRHPRFNKSQSQENAYPPAMGAAFSLQLQRSAARVHVPDVPCVCSAAIRGVRVQCNCAALLPATFNLQHPAQPSGIAARCSLVARGRFNETSL